MGEIASINENIHSAYSDEKLRQIAKDEYIRRDDRRLTRIAALVGKPVAVIHNWRDEGNWALERAKARHESEAENAARIEKLLRGADLPTCSESALNTLKLCAKAEAQLSICLDRGANHPGVEILDKALSAAERIEKLRKEAYSKLK